jgi:hypothetical protein
MGVERRGSGQWHDAAAATTGAVSASATGENDEANIRACSNQGNSMAFAGLFHCERVADSLANGLLRADKHPTTAGISTASSAAMW